jgi:hypothetical protein
MLPLLVEAGLELDEDRDLLPSSRASRSALTTGDVPPDR